jgi:hypothetical protein
MKLDAGSAKVLTKGQRIKQGDVAAISKRVPQEIVGAGGVKIVQVGNRAIVRGGAVRGSGAGGITFLGSFSSFPAIPARPVPYQFYHTGDGQLWTAMGGDSVWTPLQAATSLSGTP